MDNWGLVALSAAALFAVLVGLAVIYVRMLPATALARTFVYSFITAAAGTAAWLALAPFAAAGMPSRVYFPIAVLAGLASFLATLAVRATGAGMVIVVIFALVWTALVFVPAALMSFGVTAPLDLEPVDHGGSLAVNVATGSAALGVLLVGGSKAPRLRVGSLSLPFGALAALVLTGGWLAWLAAAEFAIDEATPGIVVNGAIGAAGGIVGWLAVQRILHQSTTITGVAAGLMSGLFSIAAGAPLFAPLAAVAAGLFAGGLACYVTLRRVRDTRRPQWSIVGSHLVAGGLGVVLLGLLATDRGFLFTGQIGLLSEQIASTVVTAVYSAGVSYLLWFGLKRLPSHAPARDLA